jgi:hypothetical protein
MFISFTVISWDILVLEDWKKAKQYVQSVGFATKYFNTLKVIK